MSLSVGDPVKITSKDLGEYGLKKGDKGWVNSITTIPGEGTFVFYMPEDSKAVFVVSDKSVKFDKSRANLVLDKDTIHKG